MDIISVVAGVQGKPTKKSGLLYEVTFADGTVAKTMDAALATAAQALLTKSVAAQYTVQEGNPNPRGGMFPPTNWLDAISEAPVGAVATTAIPIAGAPNGASAAPIPIVGGSNNGGMPPEREARIVKQSVFSTAGSVVAALFEGAGPEAADQAFEILDRHAGKLYARVYGEENVAQVAPAQTAAEVAAAVNATLPDAVQLGDAPKW